MRGKFLVILYPAPPAVRDTGAVPNQGGSYTVAKPPQVKWITAGSPREAANDVKVEPGGYALVVPEADVARFDRPKQAPLEEKMANGSSLPQAAEVAAA